MKSVLMWTLDTLVADPYYFWLYLEFQPLRTLCSSLGVVLFLWGPWYALPFLGYSSSPLIGLSFLRPHLVQVLWSDIWLFNPF